MTTTVCLCYPHPGTVRTAFMESIIRTMLTGEANLSICSEQGLYVEDSRNKLVRKFLENGSEWMWMLDTDIQFDPGTLTHLLQDANPKTAPIVSAMYLSELGGYIGPVWYVQDDSGFHALALPPRRRRTKLAGVGMGCCLIHRTALERIAERHADDPWLWFGRDVMEIDGVREHLGEDLSFCARASQAGIPIYGSGICVAHLKGRTITLEDAVAPDASLVTAQPLEG